MIANPYEVLGVSPSASNDEVKRAYREMSRKYMAALVSPTARRVEAR